MATQQKHPTLRIQHPIGILCFLVIVLTWFAARLVSDDTWEHFRFVSRLSGYAAALSMLIPYVHILRRFVRYRYLGSSTAWLSWHIGAAYLGFFFLLVHCRSRAQSDLTLALLILVWGVMLSGAFGFYGQKLLYRLLPRLVQYEYGLERLAPERDDCLDKAKARIKKRKIPASKTSTPAMDFALKTVAEFCDEATDKFLASPFTLLHWPWAGKESNRLQENRYQRARDMASDDADRELVEEIWRLVEKRRMLDLEYRLHTLGRLWLLFHGPMALAMLVLMIEHIGMSMFFGGF